MRDPALPVGQRLIAYSAYTPHYILRHSAVPAAAARGGAARSVAGYDEDSITMAVAATLQLPESRAAAGQLYFATTAQPFWDKSNASVVQAASALGHDALCVDVNGLRGGLAALCLGAKTGGIVALADVRNGRPGSPAEVESGDGAAAFLFGEGPDAVAEVIAVSSHPSELMDVWRTPGSAYQSNWEERFNTAALQQMVTQTITSATQAAGMNAPPTVVLVSSPTTRFALTASSGAAPCLEALKAHRQRAGYCGAADPGMLLAAALDVAKAGDTVLIVSAVGGTDAILFRVLRDGPGLRDNCGTSELSYFDFLTWRGLLEREMARRPDRPGVSAPATFRNQSWKFGLFGSRCTACSKVYLPPQRVCGVCAAQDEMEPYSVVGRRAQIAAMSTDGVVDSPASPVVIATVDIEGGGRVNVELTDTADEVVTVGAPVEFTFRRTYVARGAPNYFWKARLASGELS
ncbi:MAG: hydroxymethylglutaryl-CoA synthase [Bradyrhizobium sp.]|nr:hydroxymethylglutaryl-CoA synthase [Bradyrhizobium sp.]